MIINLVDKHYHSTNCLFLKLTFGWNIFNVYKRRMECFPINFFYCQLFCMCFIFLVQCFSWVEDKAHYAKSSELLEGDWRWLVWKGDARLKDKKTTQECSLTMHLYNWRSFRAKVSMCCLVIRGRSSQFKYLRTTLLTRSNLRSCSRFCLTGTVP